MEKYSFIPSKIFDADEMVVHNNQLKIMPVKGKNLVGKLTSRERGINMPILLTISATGDQIIPPLFVFPCIRMCNELKKDTLIGSIFYA